MHYTLTKVEESDFNEIYNIKKTSVQMYVEKIWGWDEQYQLNDFKNDFKNIGDFREIIEQARLYLKIGFTVVREIESHYEFELNN